MDHKFICFAFFLIFMNSEVKSQRNDPICELHSTNDRPLLCKTFKSCPSAISDLYAGVDDQIPCKVPGIKSTKEYSGFCCPTKPRISAKKCDEYTEVLKKETHPFPFLPIPFLPTYNKEIKCENPLNQLIVGGRDAKIDEFPHMAALGFENANGNISWLCGGTLITPDFVLTAAHCIQTRVGTPSKILLGDIHLNLRDIPDSERSGIFKVGNRQILGIAAIYKHPEYLPPKTYNDIALIRLERSVNLSRSILPACLPQPEYRMDKTNLVNATGWGQLGHAEAQSGILQAVNLDRYSHNQCNDYFKDQPDKGLKFPDGIIRKQICVGDKHNGTKDTCRGDSGGPLTVTREKACIFYVVGITSFGSSVCGHPAPAVYTNVQSYLDWIEDIVWPNER